MAQQHAVVIGGGITGTLTAWALLRGGWRVTLLEARHVGSGSSSRTAAGIRQQFTTEATVRGMRYAVRTYRQMAAHTEDGVSPIVQHGYLFLYADQGWDDARARAAWQQGLGLSEVEALAADDLVRRFPWVDPDAVVGGTFCPTDGFLLPAVVYQEAARQVRALGGTILQTAPVVSAQHAGGRLTAVTTPKGTLEADLFVDATNAWSPRVAAMLGGTRLPIDPLKRYIWFVRRDGPMTGDTLAGMPLVISPSGVYARPENRDTLLMGRKHDAAPEPDFDDADQDVVEPAYSHATGIDTRPYEAWAAFAEAVPPVGEFGGMTATTAGFYATTPDHNPFLGFDPAVPNLLRLVGFSGHGAMMGPFTAAVAAAMAEAGRDVAEVDLDGETVSLAEFAIGRTYADPEHLVI